MLSISSEDCTLELPSGPTTFRSTAVKPFYTDPDAQQEDYEPEQRNTTTNDAPNDTIVVDAPYEPNMPYAPDLPLAVPILPVKRRVSRPRKHPLPTEVTVFL